MGVVNEGATSKVTLHYCNGCGAVYAFDLKQIKENGLKEVWDRHCGICEDPCLVPMGDTE